MRGRGRLSVGSHSSETKARAGSGRSQDPGGGRAPGAADSRHPDPGSGETQEPTGRCPLVATCNRTGGGQSWDRSRGRSRGTERRAGVERLPPPAGGGAPGRRRAAVAAEGAQGFRGDGDHVAPALGTGAGPSRSELVRALPRRRRGWPLVRTRRPDHRAAVRHEVPPRGRGRRRRQEPVGEGRTGRLHGVMHRSVTAYSFSWRFFWRFLLAVLSPGGSSPGAPSPPAGAPTLEQIDGGPAPYAGFANPLSSSDAFFPVAVWGSYDHPGCERCRG